VSQNHVKLTKNNALAGDLGHETWNYTDGLGRIIQTRIESEPQANFAAPFRVTDVVYDQRGATKYQTLHYFAEASAFIAPTDVKSCTHTEFDVIGRPIKITPAVNVTFASGLPSGNPAPQGGETDSPLGSVTLGYFDGNDPWVYTRADEENKIRKFYLDAFGQTNRIVEVVITGTVGTPSGNYATIFQHDKLGRLVKITDSNNSVIEWAYDDLDRTVAMIDPHLGVWKWRRDFAGRMREQTDGRANLTKFFYTTTGGAQEPFGRLLKKEIYDSANALAETVQYTYDSGGAGCTVYPGQLASVTDGQGWQKFCYDVRGRTLKVERYLIINGTTYTTEQTFDDADRVQTITYPGGAPVVLNTYDTGGMLSLVQRTDGGTVTYFTSRGYTAVGQPNGTLLGNGVETSLTYYPASKRIERLRTFKGGTELQNLTYQYTAANNVKGITDNVPSHSGTASATITLATYDDLHRLTSIARPSVVTVN
jgi:YD repeat-containing protein